MLCLHFVLLLRFRIHFPGCLQSVLFSWTCEFRFLSRIFCMLLYHDSLPLIVSPDLLHCLAIIKSNFDSSLSSCYSLQVVFIDNRRDDMLNVCNTFKCGIIIVGWDTGNVEINNFSLWNIRFVVVLLGVMTSKSGREESLLIRS